MDKQRNYYWRSGQQSGKILAQSRSMAKAMLLHQGYHNVQIQWLSASSQKLPTIRISNSRRIQLIRQFIQLLESGFQLLSSLQLLGNNQPKSIKLALIDIATQVENGSSLASTMAKYSTLFDHYFISLVDAGEQNGRLVEMLQYWVDEQERNLKLRKKLRSALSYPITVLLLAMVVSSIIMLQVVPTFSHTYQQFDAELPLLTIQIMMVSQWMLDWGWTVVVSIVSVVGSQIILYRYHRGWQYYSDYLLLVLPGIKAITCKALIVRFSLALSTLLASGVPLEKALQSVQAIISNSAFQRAIKAMNEGILSGESLLSVCDKVPFFDSNSQQMIGIGEATGNLQQSLQRLALQMDIALSERIERMIAFIEPTFMIIVGAVVGTIIIAIYLPLFKMGSVY